MMTMVVTVFAILPAASRATNCGGNTAALSACRSYILTLELWEGEHPEVPFDLDSISEDIRRDVSQLPGASWLHSGRLMARRAPGKLNPKGKKEVVLVYDKPHNNVPRITFGHAPMTHAVAYSTGETGLITPEEFARLDLTGFVDLKSLQSTRSAQARDLSVTGIAATKETMSKVTIPQPTDAFNGMRTPVEFEGVILERLPSPRAWSGMFAWFQGVRYQVETVSNGPIKKGEHVVYHVLVGPPLCEDSEPILSRSLFRVGQKLRIKAERTGAGEYVGWEQAENAVVVK